MPKAKKIDHIKIKHMWYGQDIEFKITIPIYGVVRYREDSKNHVHVILEKIMMNRSITTAVESCGNN